MRSGQKALAAAAVLFCFAATAHRQAEARQAPRHHPRLPAAPVVPYYTDLPLKEFMDHVVQYTADGIWSRQGYRADLSGEHSMFPTDDAGWEAAESASRSLAEITNVLLIPGRRVDEPEWTQAVLGVRRVALEAADAAEKHDKDAFFTAGGRLDEACETCHKRYMPNYVGPESPAK